MDFDTILGIVLVVAGVMAILGEFTFAAILPYLGVILVVLGILALGDVLEMGTLVAVAMIVLGVLLNAGYLDIPGIVIRSINIIAGIVLLVLGLRSLT